MAENTQLNELEYGNVNISDDVVGIITSIAAAEIEGVNGLYGGFAEDIAEMLGVKNLQKGVKVEINDGLVTVDLNIIVDFGIRIPEVAWKVQENVKSAIENMTGLQVKDINIHVQGINIPKETTPEFDQE